MVDKTPDSGQSVQAGQRWLETPLGQALLVQETRLVEEAFDGLFGEQCLQLGTWGDANTFTRFARTQRVTTIADQLSVGQDGRPGPNLNSYFQF